MKYILLIYQGSSPLPGSDSWKALSDEEKQAIYADYSALGNISEVTSGLPMGLPSAARTVQVKDNQVSVRSGTYQQEGVDGYLVFEAENIEAAIKLSTKIPAARLGGAIEIRPAEQYW